MTKRMYRYPEILGKEKRGEEKTLEELRALGAFLCISGRRRTPGATTNTGKAECFSGCMFHRPPPALRRKRERLGSATRCHEGCRSTHSTHRHSRPGHKTPLTMVEAFLLPHGHCSPSLHVLLEAEQAECPHWRRKGCDEPRTPSSRPQQPKSRPSGDSIPRKTFEIDSPAPRDVMIG